MQPLRRQMHFHRSALHVHTSSELRADPGPHQHVDYVDMGRSAIDFGVTRVCGSRPLDGHRSILGRGRSTHPFSVGPRSSLSRLPMVHRCWAAQLGPELSHRSVTLQDGHVRSFLADWLRHQISANRRGSRRQNVSIPSAPIRNVSSCKREEHETLSLSRPLTSHRTPQFSPASRVSTSTIRRQWE